MDIKFEGNSLYQEGMISKVYQRLDKSYFQEPEGLESLVDMSRLVQKFLPMQADIDKILKIIQWKVLNGSQVPIRIRDIQAGYLVSSYLPVFSPN